MGWGSRKRNDPEVEIREVSDEERLMQIKGLGSQCGDDRPKFRNDRWIEWVLIVVLVGVIVYTIWEVVYGQM